MNPEDFLVLAEQLASQPQEAARRTAISRGYYAAFHIAIVMVETCGVRVHHSAEGHGLVSRCLQNSGNAALLHAGRKLDSLRSFRNKADYDLSSDEFKTQNAVDSHLRIAKRLVEQIHQAASNLPPIRQKIRAYAKLVRIPVFGDD